MSRTVTLAVDLPSSPARLYARYLSAKIHSAFTGAPVKIAARVGAQFEAFGGALTGQILQLIPKRLIVQSWRSTEFGKRELDSTLILAFYALGKGARVELTHVNVADRVDLRVQGLRGGQYF